MLSCKSDAFDIGNHINCKRPASETSALLDKKFWKPEKYYKFPKDKYNSSFQLVWLTDFPWLVYSDIKKGAFCERCVLFGNQQSDRNGTKMRKLFIEPYVDWKHGRKRFQQHENNSSIHSVTNEQYLRFKDNYVTNQSTHLSIHN